MEVVEAVGIMEATGTMVVIGTTTTKQGLVLPTMEGRKEVQSKLQDTTEDSMGVKTMEDITMVVKTMEVLTLAKTAMADVSETVSALAH